MQNLQNLYKSVNDEKKNQSQCPKVRKSLDHMPISRDIWCHVIQSYDHVIQSHVIRKFQVYMIVSSLLP